MQRRARVRERAAARDPSNHELVPRLRPERVRPIPRVRRVIRHRVLGLAHVDRERVRRPGKVRRGVRLRQEQRPPAAVEALVASDLHEGSRAPPRPSRVDRRGRRVVVPAIAVRLARVRPRRRGRRRRRFVRRPSAEAPARELELGRLVALAGHERRLRLRPRRVVVPSRRAQVRGARRRRRRGEEEDEREETRARSPRRRRGRHRELEKKKRPSRRRAPAARVLSSRPRRAARRRGASPRRTRDAPRGSRRPRGATRPRDDRATIECVACLARERGKRAAAPLKHSLKRPRNDGPVNAGLRGTFVGSILPFKISP